ncbi:transcription elongation factor GreB [Allohahella marinimesophila]|uniref:Transcription elongation factor GreB n=1 Tax=Allohahella marinimesophila TaxID=1054972 RepID=A0ABP7PHY0_9GAMM
MKAKLITRQGWEKLSAELQQLWKVERPEVTRAVSEAAALGDRSENAEYIYGKKRLREIDRRVGYLSRQLEDLKIVDYSPEQEGRVFFGATVEVENEEGKVVSYRIVGGDEIEAGSRNISIDSPMARALVGKQVDDEVVVKTPSGALVWTVNAIAYEH